MSAVTMLGTIPAPAGPLYAAAVVIATVFLAVAGFFAVWGYRSLGREFSSEAEVRTDTVPSGLCARCDAVVSGSRQTA